MKEELTLPPFGTSSHAGIFLTKGGKVLIWYETVSRELEPHLSPPKVFHFTDRCRNVALNGRTQRVKINSEISEVRGEMDYPASSAINW